MSPRLTFHHVDGPRRGDVDEVALPAVLGSGPEADVRAPGAAARHAVVFEREGEIVLRDAGSGEGTLIDDEAVQEAVLREGDVVQLGPGGPALRLGAGGEDTETLLEPAAWDRPGGPFGWLRGLVRDAAARVSPPVRRLVAVLVVVAAVTAAWSGLRARSLRLEVERLQEAVREVQRERARFHARVDEERRREEGERAALAAQVEELRAREEGLRRQLEDAAASEVQAMRAELATTRERLATLESERAVGERIIRDYGPGVCLVQGAYSFHDTQGRQLRVRLDEAGDAQKDADGNPLLDPEGTGPVHEVEYFGTGFLVERSGLVLTNRHVAEPWWNDAEAQSLSERGFPPRLSTLRAFFPQQVQPFSLSVERVSGDVDLALVRCDVRGRRIPALPLDRTGRGAVAGQPVVVVGYPAGLEAILAKADAAVVREILAATGVSAGRVTEALAARGLVRPSTTQGHIGDITQTDIVFDAPTTQGGSGGPILNRSGVVIGVEYAVLAKFGGNSFGVPVRHALALLAQGGKRTR
jgi:S1-C subfamily serine protease